MSETVRGIVLNVNIYGATVRLEDGRLAGASSDDVEKHRAAYDRAVITRRSVDFAIAISGRHVTVSMVPQLHDEHFEAQIAQYLKETQEWENPELPPAAQRHFLRKKRRAAIFESRHASDR